MDVQFAIKLDRFRKAGCRELEWVRSCLFMFLITRYYNDKILQVSEKVMFFDAFCHMLQFFCIAVCFFVGPKGATLRSHFQSSKPRSPAAIDSLSGWLYGVRQRKKSACAVQSLTRGTRNSQARGDCGPYRGHGHASEQSPHRETKPRSYPEPPKRCFACLV